MLLGGYLGIIYEVTLNLFRRLLKDFLKVRVYVGVVSEII
jgi:hypothetical protein